MGEWRTKQFDTYEEPFSSFFCVSKEVTSSPQLSYYSPFLHDGQANPLWARTMLMNSNTFPTLPEKGWSRREQQAAEEDGEEGSSGSEDFASEHEALAKGIIDLALYEGNVQDVAARPFFKKMVIERPLTQSELKILALLENSAKRHGFSKLRSYLSGIPEEVLRRQAKLKQECKRAGIGGDEFQEFMRYMMYCKKVAMHEPVDKEQINDILIAGNSIYLRVEDLFNGGEILTKDGVRLNGIFGKQGTIKRDVELQGVDDLMPFLYVLNHSLHKGNPLPAYFLFFGETPNPVMDVGQKAMKIGDRVFLQFNSGPWFNANIALMRMEKFLDEAVGMSLDVTPLGIIVVDKHKRSQIIPVVAAIYDLHNLTLWRVERNENAIFAQKMEQWLAKNLETMIYPKIPLFARKDIVIKHIDRLISHSNHGSEHMLLRQTAVKKVGCVDGRQDNNKSEIGSIIGIPQLMNLLTDNHTTKISIAFHTSCGYLHTALTLHKLFKALRYGIDPSDTISMGRAHLLIQVLMTKPWVKRDELLFKELMDHVDLSVTCKNAEEEKQTYGLLHNLVTDNQGTLRYATSHMSDRRVFEMQDGFPVMTAWQHVEEAITKHSLHLADTFKSLLVTEELARLDSASKTAWLADEANRELVRKKRLDHIVPTIEWFIEDFVGGRYLKVPPIPILSQTREQILSTTREDIRSGATVQVTKDPIELRNAADFTPTMRRKEEDHRSHNHHDHNHLDHKHPDSLELIHAEI